MSNRQLISEITQQSSNEKILSEIFSDHFDDITRPVSVSIGLTLKSKPIEYVVNILRKNGVNAIPFYDSKVKNDLSCFVVDGTGIRSPVLSPENAIKATADLFEIMEYHNIKTSRAMPVSKENMIPAIARTYNNKIIDIIENNPQEKDLKGFLQQQLKLAFEQPPVNFEGHHNSLYRGGTLGDNPYAITPHRRKRDGVYASNNVKTAVEYANGKKGNGFSFDEIEINGKSKVSYGFLYEYEMHDGQRFYGMAEIESPYGSEECKGHPDNRPDYETLILPDRNPLKAIYVKVEDKVVQIADGKGYFSNNWAKFAKIHTPYNTNEKNDFMVERINRQLSDFQPVEYRKENNPLPNNTSSLQFEGLVFEKNIKKDQHGNYEISDANIASISFKDISNVKFTDGFILNNCNFLQETGRLDLHQCSGIVGISDCDMSKVKEIVAPEVCNIFFMENVKLAEGSSLDLSHMECKGIVFSNQDLSKLKELRLPEGINTTYKGNTTRAQYTQTCSGVTSRLVDARAKLKECHEQINESPSPKTCLKARIDECRGLSAPQKCETNLNKTNINPQVLKLYQEQKINN